jgi:hypothetical protein
MEELETKDLKIKFLGIIPVLNQETGPLNSQEIVSFSGLLTFKGKSVQELVEESLKKGEKIDDKVKGILRRSSLKGHASLSTTPVVSFLYEGSKFLDSLLTGMYFGSFLVSSGRRTNTSREDIVFPKGIQENEEAKKIYLKSSYRKIDFYNSLLERGVRKDSSSKILQYGIYGTGIIQLPLESIISFVREYEIEREWMPEEAGILIKKLESKFKEVGIDLLYSTRLIAPRNSYPYPNVFKDPKNTNLTRELVGKKEGDFEISSSDFNITPGLKKKLEEHLSEIKEMAKSREGIKKRWQEIMLSRRKILRDYNLSAKIDVLSSVPWRVWGEKKRHRTCPQVIDSIYYCINKAVDKFEEVKEVIEKGEINQDLVKEIEKVLSIPSVIKNNPDYLKEYLLVAKESFESYVELVDLGIKERDAIFLIPRAVKLDILQSYDLYNLLTGYYPLRLCQTAEEEMRSNTLKEVSLIKKHLKEKGVGWMGDLILTKCDLIGFCPEVEECGHIRKLVKDYDKDFHEEMKEELENKFQNKLKEINGEE